MDARKIKGTGRDSTPAHLVSVGLQTRPSLPTDSAGVGGRVFHSARIVYHRRSRGEWREMWAKDCGSVAAAWEAIDSTAAPGRRVYVVAGRASDSLTLLGWWERVRSGECQTRYRTRSKSGKGGRLRAHPLVMQGRPDIIGYSLGGGSFRWVSVTNWADVSMADCAAQVGAVIPASADVGGKWEQGEWPAALQAEVIGKYMIRLLEWWGRNRCGGWKDTPGAAAWASFLRVGQGGGIIQHAEPDALRLESLACFGGRASLFCLRPIGDVERWSELADAPPPGPYWPGLSGPIHRLDVRSMYPSIMRDELFPTRLLWSQDEPTLADLRERLKCQLAVARVTIRTERSVYPKREPGGVAYPVGTFVTTLSTPDLRAALVAGEVVTVHRANYYTPGRPFKTWAEWVLSLRQEMKSARDICGEAMVKLLANSLGGRLARLKMGWTDKPNQPPRVEWGDWWVTDAKTDETSHWRALCGMTQLMVRETDRPGTLAACYSHLTGYGRQFMEGVRATAGRRDVIWQDTDGVFVTSTGRKRLERSKFYHPTEPGKLRFEHTVANARFLTPKHYWIDGHWVLAGIHDGFTVRDGITAEDVVTVNPARSAADPSACAVYQATRSIDLTAIEPGTGVGPDGWAVPPAIRSAGETKRLRKGQLIIEGECQ